MLSPMCTVTDREAVRGSDGSWICQVQRVLRERHRVTVVVGGICIVVHIQRHTSATERVSRIVRDVAGGGV